MEKVLGLRVFVCDSHKVERLCWMNSENVCASQKTCSFKVVSTGGEKVHKFLLVLVC